jgi:prevent-host-death family protein
MAKVPTIIPITDLRQDAAAAIKRARDQREPIIITQRGRAAAVMLSIEVYEQAEYERELLLQIARGEREIELGDGVTLESVLADADRILSSDDV